MAQVTPWEVKGKVDYNRLVNEFGVSKLDNPLLKRIKQQTGDLHPLLSRKIFFAHRDLAFALDEHKKNNLFLYTGCGPSGPVHLGHSMIWDFTKWLQEKLDIDLWFQFTDDEKFLFKDKSYEEIQKWTHENMLDVIALGFNPKKTHFLINTRHANIIYPEAVKVAKKITLSTAKAAFGFNNQSNIGKIFYASMQAVPAFLPSVIKGKKMACLIPHAVDQDPIFRVSRDVIKKLGYPKPTSIQGKFLPSLKGEKMSSSDPTSYIALTDSPAEAAKKIKKYAFSGGQVTVAEHRKKGGNPHVDVAYQLLRYGFEPDDKKLKKIHDDYMSGALLSGELKNILVEKMTYYLLEHQKKRKKAEKMLDKFIYKI